MKLKKMYFMQLPGGNIKLTPLEEIDGCTMIISPGKDLSLCVQKEDTPSADLDATRGRVDVGFKELSNDDIKVIKSNDSKCYVEVDKNNKIKLAEERGSNKLVLYFSRPGED